MYCKPIVSTDTLSFSMSSLCFPAFFSLSHTRTRTRRHSLSNTHWHTLFFSLSLLLPQHAPLFTTDGKRLVDAPFLRALNSPDIYLQRSASLGLACLYTVRTVCNIRAVSCLWIVIVWRFVVLLSWFESWCCSGTLFLTLSLSHSQTLCFSPNLSHLTFLNFFNSPLQIVFLSSFSHLSSISFDLCVCVLIIGVWGECDCSYTVDQRQAVLHLYR